MRPVAERKVWLVVGYEVATYERTIKRLLDERSKRTGKPVKVYLLVDKHNPCNELIKSWCLIRKVQVEEVKADYAKHGKTAGYYRDLHFFKFFSALKNKEVLYFEDEVTASIYSRIALALKHKIKGKHYNIAKYTKKGEIKEEINRPSMVNDISVVSNRLGLKFSVTTPLGTESLLLKKHSEGDMIKAYNLIIGLLNNEKLLVGNMIIKLIDGKEVDFYKLEELSEKESTSAMTICKIKNDRRYIRVKLDFGMNCRLRLILDKNKEEDRSLHFILDVTKSRNDTALMSSIVFYLMSYLLKKEGSIVDLERKAIGTDLFLDKLLEC